MVVILIFIQNICCGYLMELPWLGHSSEYQDVEKKIMKTYPELSLQLSPYLKLKFYRMNGTAFTINIGTPLTPYHICPKICKVYCTIC